MSSTGPLFVSESASGELFLHDGTLTDRYLDDAIVLDDAALWDAYEAARNVTYAAALSVLSSLRKPAPAEVRALPPPSEDEITALARIYMADCLRYCLKIDRTFQKLAGVSDDLVESAWASLTSPVVTVSPEMLRSKGWISDLGDGHYRLTRHGIKQLYAAVPTSNHRPGRSL